MQQGRANAAKANIFKTPRRTLGVLEHKKVAVVMFYSYQTFLKDNKDALSIERCDAMYQVIQETLSTADSEFIAYWEAFVRDSVAYTAARGEWLLLSRDEKHALDEGRTIKHNKVITNFKIISRLIALEGGDNSLFEAIQDNRKQVGDFANYISFVYALNGR
ncbi:hypothetical protein [Streptococcus hyovaginalis]|uniref:hypothetical protein n=1 Tax=Streptococcus hyovaginalis TaxID=149015 RepID=UPI002A81C23A|nr:hypothetical protein [Streptococcus hyovaginalis]